MTVTQEVIQFAAAQLGSMSFTQAVERTVACRRFGVINALAPVQLPACALDRATWKTLGREVNDDAIPVDLVASTPGWPDRIVHLYDAIDTKGTPLDVVREQVDWVQAVAKLDAPAIVEESGQPRLRVDGGGDTRLYVGAQLQANNRVARHLLAHLVCPYPQLALLVDAALAWAASTGGASLSARAVGSAEHLFQKANKDGRLSLLGHVRRSLLSADGLCWPLLGCGVGTARVKVLDQPVSVVDTHILKAFTQRDMTLIDTSQCALCGAKLDGESGVA